MAQAKKGDTVKVHYTGRLQDGEEFDTSRDGDPLEFTLGEQQLIAGFEDAVVGMAPGETKAVVIDSENAYGPWLEELQEVIARDQFPGDVELQIGLQLQAQTEDNESVVLTVTDFNDETVTLDANHPLAGMDLTFDLELVEIVEA